MNWRTDVHNLGTANDDLTYRHLSGSSGVGFRNEDFIVWMRTAAFPTFRKLYRKIQDNGAGKKFSLFKLVYFFRSSTWKLRVADLLQLSSSPIRRRKVFRSRDNFLDRRQKLLPRLDVRYCRWNLPDRHALFALYLSTQPQSRLILAFNQLIFCYIFLCSSNISSTSQVKTRNLLHFQASQRYSPTKKENNCIRSYGKKNMKNIDPINCNSSFADVKNKLSLYHLFFKVK